MTGLTLSKQTEQHVDEWIQKLSDNDMPVFAGTVTDVTSTVNSDDTSAADVASTILKDASLTGRLLKLANSFYFNPGRYTITTVTRAVMVLGFDQVRALALSLVLIDSLDNDASREKIADEMAQSFHAAVQAEELAKLTKNKSPENVFVATLLYRLGNMAFWAFSGDKGVALQTLMDSGTMNEHDAELEVLGFHLSDLTKGLSKSWSLGELLDNSFNGNYKEDPVVQLIHMGQDLAQASKNGWDESEAQDALKYVAKKLSLPLDKIEDIAHNNAKQAKKITKDYGITAASKRIPQAKIILLEPDDAPAEHKNVSDEHVESPNLELDEQLDIEQEQPNLNNELTHSKKIDVGDSELPNDKLEPKLLAPEPDAAIQLSVLQEITEAIAEKPSINVILEMVLEGIYRGVGMDRSLFAILSKDRKRLVCKYALGAESEKLNAQFNIDISHSSNIFHQAIMSKKGVHIPSNPKQIQGTVSRDTFKLLGFPPYLIMPTIVRGKVIGLFLADRNASKRLIEDKDFLAFQQFCQQANMGLTFLTMQD